MVQTSYSGRVVTLVAVSQGNVFSANAGDVAWTAATNSTTGPINPPLTTTLPIFSAPNNQKLYFADGSVNFTVFDPSTQVVSTWVATAGSLPLGSDNATPRLICTWRGRTVLAGLVTDPQNWFMSAIGDPTNWDYAPVDPSSAQAVSGSNAPQGLVGDVVTALIPYTDDVMIFGCDHSIYLMQGDPMAGGIMSLISDRIGIAFGQAWVKDPYGNVYFVSNRTGIYSLVPGQQPQRISQGIEQLLVNIDMGLNSIRMEWDDIFQGFHVFVTLIANAAATTHFFYETRTGAWWTDVFSNPNHNPLATCQFDGNNPNDRVVCIGAWDGVVRYLDRNAQNDDGRIIQGNVIIGPVRTDQLDVMMLKNIQMVLGADSGAVQYSILYGDTAEAALAQTPAPQLSGTFNPGMNLTGLIRRAAKILYLQITSNIPWRMEQARAYVETSGKVRQRGKG